VHLPAALPADPATQQSPAKPVNVDDQILLCFLHFRHGMRLQSQLLSHERFDEHLDPAPLGTVNISPQKDWMNRGFKPATPPPTSCV
jgi:hypothetical protein